MLHFPEIRVVLSASFWQNSADIQSLTLCNMESDTAQGLWSNELPRFNKFPPNMAVFRIQQACCLKPLRADEIAKTLILFKVTTVSYFLKVMH